MKQKLLSRNIWNERSDSVQIAEQGRRLNNHSYLCDKSSVKIMCTSLITMMCLMILFLSLPRFLTLPIAVKFLFS